VCVRVFVRNVSRCTSTNRDNAVNSLERVLSRVRLSNPHEAPARVIHACTHARERETHTQPCPHADTHTLLTHSDARHTHTQHSTDTRNTTQTHTHKHTHMHAHTQVQTHTRRSQAYFDGVTKNNRSFVLSKQVDCGVFRECVSMSVCACGA